MLLIKQLIEYMNEELEGANNYAECALKHMEDNKELANMFYRMSNTEIEHYNMLHDAVVKQISKYKMEQGTPPIAMQTIYDWEHEKAIHELLDIKKKLGMFKSSM